MPEGESSSGIDLHPLGWDEAREGFDLADQMYVDVPLEDGSIASFKTSASGTVEEVLVVAHGEKLGNGRLLVHNYRVVSGVLTEAVVLDLDTNGFSKDSIRDVRRADLAVGLGEPSDSDAKKLVDLMRNAGQRQINGEA